MPGVTGEKDLEPAVKLDWKEAEGGRAFAGLGDVVGSYVDAERRIP